jgi:EAL domain-containing protein (putative c-di-GMP-specific phosphodiesterase class I)
VVLEIHEDTMVDAVALKRFHEQVKEMGLQIAYDDFGAGQPRLAELAEAPPDFIKLDMKLVRGIDQSPGRQELIKALRHLADQRNILMIAEGLETQAEADVCQRLGCELGQGYLLGRPQSVSLFVKGQRTEEMDLRPVRRELARREA